MHIAAKFRPRSTFSVVAHLNEIRMGTIITASNGTFSATPLPWVVRELTDDQVELLGHFAASNPQVDDVRRSANALVVFLGPNAYVSPRDLPTPHSAPTWNYVAIHVAGQAELVGQDATELSVETLVASAESSRQTPLTSAEMGARRDMLLRHVVGVRLVSNRIDANSSSVRTSQTSTFQPFYGNCPTAGTTALFL